MKHILVWALIAAIGYVAGTITAMWIAEHFDVPEHRRGKQARQDFDALMSYFDRASRDTGPVRVLPG